MAPKNDLKIQMVDLHGQYLRIRHEIDNAISRVISQSDFIRGHDVAMFEKELAGYMGVRHCITCGNGTDALILSLMAIGLKPGDEVVVPAFSFAAPAEAVAFLGGTPVFADCGTSSFNMDAESLGRCISSRTKAVIPVHLFGRPCDMTAITAIAENAGITVIEDNAQSLGAVCECSNGVMKHAGTIGRIGCTSFFPSKVLGCFGDGGAMFTNDDNVAEHLRRLANHGQKQKYDYREIGMNSRLDSIQAAVLRVKLRYLDEYISLRRNTAALYNEAFDGIDGIIAPECPVNATHVWHQYTLQVPPSLRNSLKACLEAAGTPAAIYYNMPLYKQNAYKNICRYDSGMMNANNLTRTVLSLPMHTELNQEQLQFITGTVKQFLISARQ
jgi:dTDP-4-amino-4,6-dideoxygalactose transaminase